MKPIQLQTIEPKTYLIDSVLDVRPVIEIKLLHPDAKVPQYATQGSAAVDLCACAIPTVWQAQNVIFPGQSAKFRTGIAVNINNPNIVGLLDGRSGLGFKRGIRLSNCVGIIDSDYQGEIIVSLHNDSDEIYYINKGDRIAQLLFVPVIQPNFMVVSEFSTETERGVNGIRSSGK